MNYYILKYDLVDSYLQERTKYRSEHLGMAQDHLKSGDLVLGGAMDSPPDAAILVFKGDSPEVAEEFAQNDPYVKNGLVKSWTVKKWNVVVGNE